MLRNTLTSILLLILSGCVLLPIPHDRDLTPTFFGRVSDAETGEPVEGVKITLETLWKKSETGQSIKKSVFTDENGNYKIALIEHDFWYEIWLGPLEGYCGGVLNAEHENYISQKIEKKKFGSGSFDSVCKSYEIDQSIELEKESSP